MSRVPFVLPSVLFSSSFAISYAQVSKINAWPAYDNVNKEREWNTSKNRAHQQKYALLNANEKTQNKAVLSNSNKQSLTDVRLREGSNPLNRYYIKKVTFPGTQKK